MTDYISATKEIFGVLKSAWMNPYTGAMTVIDANLTGDAYMPALQVMGDVRIAENKTQQIYAKAQYQTVTDGQSSFRNGELVKKYASSGMLGVQILIPKNIRGAYDCGRLLAKLVQAAFRNSPTGGSCWYSRERIIEVGAIQNYNQINVFINCYFETFEGGMNAIDNPSNDGLLTVTAAQTISAYLAVAEDGSVIASSDNVALRAIGVNTGGVVSGGLATIRYSGELTFNGWNWTLGYPIYLGLNGVLTQTSPLTGFQQIVGYPVEPQTMIVEIQEITVFA